MLGDKMVITNGKDRFGYVRHVQFVCTFGPLEVYRVQETGRDCVRDALGSDLVRWCSASYSFRDGYEAGAPFKDGLMLIAVDDTGAEIGMEATYQTEWNGKGLADKGFPFSWESE